MPAAEKFSEISPIFTVAQAALESGWGKSKIGEYNLFGVTKGSSWKGNVLLVTTTEYFSRPDVTFTAPEQVLAVKRIGESRYKYTVKRYFRDYPTLEAALADHFRILSGPGYTDAWPYRKSPEEYVKRLVDNIGSKYATALNYVEAMNNMFKTVRRYVG
jgi:flagellar protein FlgJ